MATDEASNASRDKDIGSPLAGADRLRARVASGEVALDLVSLAAFLGHPGAAMMVSGVRVAPSVDWIYGEDGGQTDVPEDQINRWALTLGHYWGREASVRALIAATELVRPGAGARGAAVDEALAIARGWVRFLGATRRDRANAFLIDQPEPRINTVAACAHAAAVWTVSATVRNHRRAAAIGIGCAAQAVWLATGGEDQTHSLLVAGRHPACEIDDQPWAAGCKGRPVREVIEDAIRAALVPWALGEDDPIDAEK